MSLQLPEPGKINWGSHLKFIILYPSTYDLVTGSTQGDYIAGVLDNVEVEGIGYEHEDINGYTNWSLGKNTLPSKNKNGTILIAETDWVYTLLRWLAASDSRFDIRMCELDADQNPKFGQWVPGQESYLGCFVNPISKKYSQDGKMPKAKVPFTYTIFEYQKDGVVVSIGQGIFGKAGLVPTVPPALT